MKRFRSPRTLPRVVAAVALVTVAAFGLMAPRHPEWWLSPDQSGDRLLRAGRFGEAASVYQDPMRRGVALYRAGRFQEAADAFGRVGSPEGAFDRGNALVMLGKYDDAIKSFDRALALRPGWVEAEQNRAVARVRRERMNRTGGDATGGEVAPDEIVFETKPQKPGGDEVEVAGGDPLSDDQLRSLWLRRVQTRPTDFLRAKFSYQVQDKGQDREPGGSR